MKNISKIILVYSLFFVGFIKAQGPAFNYAKQIGATGDDAGLSIVTDNSGNVYVTGWFNGTPDFDPGPGTYTLSAAGASNDIFVTKFDQLGNFLWAKQIGGNNNDQSRSIALDANGDVYITGQFVGTCDFDPSAISYTLTAANQDAFFMKLDPSGNFIWAKQIGEITAGVTSYGVAIDALNNCYFTGTYGGNVDFDPGPSTYTLNAVQNECYVLKLNTNGIFLWAKSLNGSLNGSIGNGICVDASNNVISTGYYAGGTTDFDPSASNFPMTVIGQKDIFIWKLDSFGNFVWAKSFSGTSNEEGYSISTDNNDNVYTTGYFKNTVDFDPSVSIYTLNSTSPSAQLGDVFVSKLDKLGNFKWAKQIGGSASMNVGYSIKVDNLSNSYIAGMFNGTVDFDPGISTFSVTSLAGDNDIFVAKLDSLGSFQWAKTMQGSMDDKAYSVALDNSGSVYLTGSFTGNVDFDPGPSTYTMTNPSVSGIPDIFIVKLSCQTPTINATASSSAICNGNSVTLTVSGASTYTWNPGGLNGATITVSPTSNTTYSVIGADVSGCSNSATKSVTVNALPTLTTSISSSVICNGAIVTLGVTGATSYTWNPGNLSSSSVTVNPTSNTTYSVVGIDANGCSNTSTKSVTVNPIPTLTTTVSSSAICNGASVTLGVSGASSYTWNPGNLSGASITVSPTSNTTFTVIGSSINSCSNSATKTVTVNSVPSLTTSISSSSICKGASANLSVSGATTYTWNPGNLTTGSITVNPTSTTTFTVIGSANNCTSSVTLSLNVNPVPSVTLTVNNIKCNGQSNGSATVTVNGGTLPYSYLWSNGNVTSQSNTLTAGSYSVQVSDLNSCSTSSTMIITEPTPLSASVNVTSPSCTEVSDGLALLDVNGGVNPYSIAWSNGIATLQHENLSAGNYSVNITDANTCTYTLSVVIPEALISCFFVPNGFSPNGDGINDTWQIIGIAKYPTAEVTVLNRWGQIVFSSSNYSEPWNGNFNGNALPTSDYYYIINLMDGSKALTGTLTIKR